eukprot:186650-Chlamydomonas_euryale.AAC.7
MSADGGAHLPVGDFRGAPSRQHFQSQPTSYHRLDDDRGGFGARCRAGSAARGPERAWRLAGMQSVADAVHGRGGHTGGRQVAAASAEADAKAKHG